MHFYVSWNVTSLLKKRKKKQISWFMVPFVITLPDIPFKKLFNIKNCGTFTKTCVLEKTKG